MHKDQRGYSVTTSDPTAVEALDRAFNAYTGFRTDAMVQYQYVEPVLREAALAGVTDAAIAVRQEALP